MLKKYCPLRERKYARTKQAILNALLEKLRTQHLEEISIKEICEDANISEGTFFNYFPKKQDVLVYYIAIWSIEVSWHAQKKEEQGSSLAAIEEIYFYTADIMRENVTILYEVISLIAQEKETPLIKDITLAEKFIAFKKFPGAENLKAKNFIDIMRPFLKHAINNNELPKNTDIDLVLLTLRSIFFGTPIAVSQAHASKLKKAYQYHLHTYWHSLKSTDSSS